MAYNNVLSQTQPVCDSLSWNCRAGCDIVVVQSPGSRSSLRIGWPKYWSTSFSISPSNEYSGLISFFVSLPFFTHTYLISKSVYFLSPVRVETNQFLLSFPWNTVLDLQLVSLCPPQFHFLWGKKSDPKM